MPGKTSTINFFTTDKIDFVDLPGYGYAKVAKSEKARWSEMINGYFDQYRYYALVVSLIDIRHPATKLDEQMIEFLRACELPFIIALTKADKLSKSQAAKQNQLFENSLVSPTAFLLLYVLQPTEQALMNCEGLLRMPQIASTTGASAGAPADNPTDIPVDTPADTFDQSCPTGVPTGISNDISTNTN